MLWVRKWFNMPWAHVWLCSFFLLSKTALLRARMECKEKIRSESINWMIMLVNEEGSVACACACAYGEREKAEGASVIAPWPIDVLCSCVLWCQESQENSWRGHQPRRWMTQRRQRQPRSRSSSPPHSLHSTHTHTHNISYSSNNYSVRPGSSLKNIFLFFFSLFCLKMERKIIFNHYF